MAHNYPERTVENNVLASSTLPPLRVQVDSALTYLGNLKSTIHNQAHIDNYYFVERDDEGFITRLVYLQFEGYLPDVEASYTYPDMQPCKLGREAFMYDGGVRRFAQTLIDSRGPDSDVAQTVEFLANHGACFSEGAWYAHLRFVKVLGEDQRNEVLLLYLERVDAVPDDIAEKSRESADWSHYCQALCERATKLFHMIE
jgi:hypothetical protein